MKKRTKSKSKSSGRLSDSAVPFCISVAICLVCAGLCYFRFHSVFFRALSKMDEKPVATITFKYRTAERKFLDRVVWDRLRQNSPVYNGDTIHTAELSEATVWFPDGTTLELSENTMAQIFLRADGTLSADLDEGSLTAGVSEDGGGMEVTSGSVKVSVDAGSVLSATKSGGGDVSLSMRQGGAKTHAGEGIVAGECVLVEDGEKKEPPLSVKSPFPNEKFLYHTEGLFPVDFEWAAAGGMSNLSLEISSDRNFGRGRSSVESVPAQKIDVSGLESVSVSLPKGVHYWRLSDGANSCSGRFQIVQSFKPELVVPASDFSYAYRKQPPSIRFIWLESEAASAYSFAVSKNIDMSDPIVVQRTSSPSLIISTLTEGTYYYQITPYYAVANTGLSNPSAVGSFIVEKKGTLAPPSLVCPVDGSFFDRTNKSEVFSWRMDDEPSTYSVFVSRKRNLSEPVISRKTGENYMTLSVEELNRLSDGEYFWGVTQTDSEGNVSPISEIRSFFAVAGEIEQRTVFPPDGYRIWQPLLGDTRFTWKSNLSLPQYIQIASDSGFQHIVLDSEISGGSFSGADLGLGEFYWRITTKAAGFKRSTEAKKIVVVDELPAPKIEFPSVSKKAVVRPNKPCLFAWSDSAASDYYRVKIFRKGSEAPLSDESFITGNSVEFDMEDYEEGLYRWEIQSFTYETDSSSRRSSHLSSSEFFLRKVEPAVLLYPPDGAELDGWQAIESPPALVFSSREPCSRARIVLSKIDGSPDALSFPQSSFSQQLPPLSSGIYEWTVEAVTMDEIDISPAGKFSFRVGKIPPFDSPENAVAEGGPLFDAEYLRKNPRIVFSWRRIPRASAYILEIFSKNGRLLHMETVEGNENTSLSFGEFSKLSKGDFLWRVRGIFKKEGDDEILVDGIPHEGVFTIDYKINSSGGKRQNKGELYAH